MPDSFGKDSLLPYDLNTFLTEQLQRPTTPCHQQKNMLPRMNAEEIV